MGKRRTNAPQGDRYNPDEEDDDEVEENVEVEPLKETELANIKQRKKLIAKRRISSNETSTASNNAKPFSMFMSGSKVEVKENESEKAAPSVFTGFKGFGAYKPSATAATTTTTATSSSLFNGGSSISITKMSNEPTTTTTTATTTTTQSLFKSDSVTPKSTSFSNGEEAQTKKPMVAESTNLNETELAFINGLNELFERCYGANKRAYKIPSDEEVPLETSEAEPEKKKYAFLLAELNRHCSKWITKHVEENPLIILTPVLVDYFNYLVELEKHFFPDTFSKLEKGSKAAVSLNGSSVTSSTAAPSLFSFKPSIEKEAVKTNGHKETSPPPKEKPFSFATKVNGEAEAKKDTESSSGSEEDEEIEEEEEDEEEGELEEEEEETQKKLAQSSKTFASLIKTQPFSPIPGFSFKPFSSTAEATKEPPKETPKPVETTSSFFKPTAPTTTTTTTTTPVSQAFSFGALSKPTEEKKPSIESSASLSAKFDAPLTSTSSTAPTFKFGSPVTEEKKTDFLAKPLSTTTTTLPNILPSSSTNTSANLFSFLTKPTSEPATTAASTATTTTTTTTANPFSSLLNNQSQPSTTESSNMKPFSGFGSFQTSGSSLFSSTTSTQSTGTTPASATTTTTTATAASSFTFGGFQSLNNKPSLFGASSASIFGSGASTFGSAPISFGAAPAGEAGDDEEYEPPKPESNEIKEEGAVFSKKTKLYYFNDKDKKFTERGVGYVFLKPINGGESTQLLVRADTALGNILLNVKLAKTLPVDKMGPKDVSLICVPNPAIPNTEPNAPCKFLFKVKSEDDAKELLEKFNELKK